LVQVCAKAAIAPAAAAVGVVVAALGRYAIAALVSFGHRRCLQKMRRRVAKMFSVSEPAGVVLENGRDRPDVEAGRAHGAGVSRMVASSC
jgi:hypothetical protein